MMLNSTWAWVRKTLPVEIRLLVFGVLTGLAAGALRLDESVDTATAVGIATGFSVAMGPWLGIRLYLIVARLYTVWIAAIRKRVTDIESRLHSVEPPTDRDGVEQVQAPFAIHIVAFSIYLSPLCFAMSLYSAIVSALWIQMDCPCASATQAFALVSLICSSGLLVLATVIQCVYILLLQRRVALLERQLDQAGLISPVTARADVLDSNITRTERLVRRFVGIGGSTVERASA